MKSLPYPTLRHPFLQWSVLRAVPKDNEHPTNPRYNPQSVVLWSSSVFGSFRRWSGNSLLWILPREVNGEGPDALVPEKALAESSCEWCFNQNNSGLLSVTVQRMRNDNEWYTFARIREYVVGNFSASLSRYPQTKPTIYSISRYAGKSRGRGYVPPDKWRRQVGVNK